MQKVFMIYVGGIHGGYYNKSIYNSLEEALDSLPDDLPRFYTSSIHEFILPKYPNRIIDIED